MTARWLWRLRQLSRRIWVRATLFSLAAVATALVAALLSPYIPSDLPAQIGADAVDNILGIIAASMLTVTTFSLTTMVGAYSAATSNVTPRATTLMMEDATTQNMLATFIGSFLFSLVGIIALSAGIYGESGRVVLFGVTLAVILGVVVTLLRWIDHLSRLGRVTETTRRVEAAALAALRERHREPAMGGAPLRDPDRDIPREARAVYATEIGYVQHVDVAGLADVAKAAGGRGADGSARRIFVRAVPGDFLDPTRPIACFAGFEGEDVEAGIRACFTIGDVRAFDQDPRFGISVLAEIASRALSPATNDLGTAIDIVGRTVRVLAALAEPREGECEIEHPNVLVPPLDLADLFDDLFIPIARDGATLMEIGVRLQKALLTLSRLDAPGFAEEARRHAAEALQRFEAGLTLDVDKRRVREAASWLGRGE
ncbi:DUF2254 domain-containing protein [Aureimonas sp. AU40]|uniref:DUF2254 domain-containing protein n=1 Tax=Aureimonas sp. AU40 TaxID=1637747 RepID=UPI00078404E0|nr:DUF2254 domain-containing protein [Aureimonas sp. AU40]